MAKKQKTANESETVNVATEPTPVHAEPTPTKRGHKPKVIAQDAAGDAAPTSLASEPTTAPEPAPAPKERKARANPDATLADVFAGYLRSLEDAGKSEGTIFSYRLELVMAGAELGSDTRIADLTPERVLLFFTSDRVMKTRGGRPKSPLSMDKTRRVVRQALVWAESAGMVAKAPVPELTATH